MRTYVNSIKTPSTLTVIFNNGDPVLIPASSPLFQRVEELISAGKTADISAAIDTPVAVKTGKFTVNADGVIIISGKPLPRVLSDRLLQLVAAEIDTSPLERFWENCLANPATESADELFDFIEHNHFPITMDGCFVGYKAVGLDYKDIHSKSFDNRPGHTIRMDRNMVDPDRRHECSTGFHVGGYDYASKFGGGPSKSRMMEVKVNPRHVVAVPRDSQYGKVRVCQYEVIRENPSFKKLTEQVYSGTRATQKKAVITKKADGSQVKSASIRRLPAGLKMLAADKTGGLSIPFEIASRLFTRGQQIFAVIANARTRSITLTATKPASAMVVKELKVGDNTRIYSSIFNSAQINGRSSYNLAISSGALIIR